MTIDHSIITLTLPDTQFYKRNIVFVNCYLCDNKFNFSNRCTSSYTLYAINYFKCLICLLETTLLLNYKYILNCEF